jgi:prepilin-type processing-associated H-X9-DG protein
MVLAAACLAVAVFLILTVRWLIRLAEESTCSCTLQQLAKGMIGDAERRGGRLPPADTWHKESIGNGHTTEDGLYDPAEAGSGRCYAMNRSLSGKSLGDIRFRDRTVLLFDCVPGGPPAGGPELLPARPRHPDGHGVAFCDGHVKFVPKERLGELIWDPNPEPRPAR